MFATPNSVFKYAVSVPIYALLSKIVHCVMMNVTAEEIHVYPFIVWSLQNHLYEAMLCGTTNTSFYIGDYNLAQCLLSFGYYTES
jgi:hypothetical protein